MGLVFAFLVVDHYSFDYLYGIINAYNFMDGINGITGGYSLVSLVH